MWKSPRNLYLQSLLPAAFAVLAAVACRSPDTGHQSAVADFEQARQQTAFFVEQIRKLPESSPGRFNAELKYSEARGAVNAAFEELKGALRSSINPSAHPGFVERSKVAMSAVNEFKKNAYEAVVPKAAGGEGLQVREQGLQARNPVATTLLLSVGGALWDKVSAAMAKSEQQRIMAVQSAELEINTKVWPAFKDVKP